MNDKKIKTENDNAKQNSIKIFDVSKIENLNESEKEILESINNNPVAFLDNNIVDFSKLYYSSKSSVSRLSQKLGFKYLIDMKLFVRGRMAINEFYDVNNGDDTTSIINNLRAYNMFGINETLLNINIKDIQNICSEITKAKRVFCFGLGSSYLPAYELSSNLLKLGINSTSTNEIHKLLLALSSSGNQEILILFSKSAKTKEILYLIKVCKDLEINTVLITHNDQDKIDVKFKILISDIKKNKRLIETSSKISMIAIVDLIYHEIFHKKNYSKYLDKANELLEG